MALTTQNYLDAAAPSLDRLRAHFAERPFHVSDIVDTEGHQYVNLVQEGGGVLGLALVGYTYVLEQMGVRFMKMAGTSAGAINTMLLSALGEKSEAKSLRILDILNRQNLFEFVDGDPVVRRLVRHFVTSKGYFQRLRNWVVGVLAMLIIAVLGLAFSAGRGEADWVLWLFLSLTIVSAGLVGYGIWWLFRNRRKFYHAEFGMNPGQAFQDWMTKILETAGIRNLHDLERHVAKVPAGGFRLNRPDSEPLEDLNRPRLDEFLVLVASDVTNRMKVEFPRLWPLYWADANQVSPSFFVRASMAVPLFFKPFIVRQIPREQVRQAWQERLNITNPDLIAGSARFVDGAMISNFPISVFYNAQVQTPRLPTFGVRLGLREVYPVEDFRSFGGYANAMFETLRLHYDKEFLTKNAGFGSIGHIDVSGVNWLNFNVTDAEKLDLFRRGAEAAATFFIGNAPAADEGYESTSRGGFDWENYKTCRRKAKTRTEVN